MYRARTNGGRREGGSFKLLSFHSLADSFFFFLDNSLDRFRKIVSCFHFDKLISKLIDTFSF